jgi:hypothetical protein
VQTYFSDYARESTTSCTSSIKGGNSDINESDINKNNIIKTTFDTLTKEARKAFKAYHADLEELFLSRYEITRQGPILKDTTPIVIRKAEVTPEVWHNSLPSLNDVQSMINSMLERQVKSTDELLCRLIEEWDGEKLDNPIINPSSSCVISFVQTYPQISGT